MNQRIFKSPSGSQASTQHKSTTPHSEEQSNSSSQRLPPESPVPQNVLECNPESSKTNFVKKPLSAKLALLLDVHKEKGPKSKPLSSTTKHFLNTASISPLKEHTKSTSKQLNTILCIKKNDSILSNKENSSLRNNQQRQKKPFIKNTLIDLETPTKETKRIRKFRSKNFKLSIDQGNRPFVHQPCNFSHSPENSLFVKSLANTVQKQLVDGTPLASQTLKPTSLQNLDYYPATVTPKDRVKLKKNFSISEAIPSETQRKAYLSHNSSHNQQFHRKVGSTSCTSISNVFAKSFTKLDSCYSLNTQVSPAATNLGLKIPQSIDTISSRHATARDTAKSTTKRTTVAAKKGAEVSLEQLNKLRRTFDSLINNFENHLNNVQDNQDILKNIKQEYEECIEKLMKSNKQLREQKKTGRAISEENRQNKQDRDNLRLIQENIKLQQELTDIRTDRQRLQDLVKTLRIRNNTNSPNHSVLPTEKRGPGVMNVSPPPTKHGKKLEQEVQALKQTVAQQQATIQTMRKKEERMMRLIYTLKKQGVDVENIYNQQVKTKFEQTTTQEDTLPSQKISEAFEKHDASSEDPALRGKLTSEVTRIDSGRYSYHF